VRLTSSNVFAAEEDKILMKLLQNEKDYKAKKYVKEFPQQKLVSVCLSSLNDLLKKIAQVGIVDRKPRGTVEQLLKMLMGWY